MKNLHFALCFDEKYAQYASVCMKSIADCHKNDKTIIHAISDKLLEQTKNKLRSNCENLNCTLQFHIISDESIHELPTNLWPIHAWYRILLPDILPDSVDKVLYLDCDTLVTANLKHLYEMELENIVFAAVEDPQSYEDSTYKRCGFPKKYGYICSGVMMFNLKVWRKEKIKDQLIEYALINKDKIKFPDQDCLNSLYYERKEILPFKYGMMDAFFMNKEILSKMVAHQVKEGLDHPFIIHYASCAPWIREFRPSIFSEEWDKVNKSLKYKAKVKYYSHGIKFVKMMTYKILHPFKTYKKKKARLTKAKAYGLLKSL